MTDKKNSAIDEKFLFERKANFNGYIFCPHCRSRFEKRKIDGHERLKCTNPDCGFVYYHNPAPAAGAIVIKQGKILLVKRAAEPKKDWWCIPAGFMEWSEHPSETAVRELHEETGLEIKLESLFEIYSGHDDPRTNAVLILYLASVTGGVLKAADDASEAGFFGFDEIPEKIAFISHRQAIKDYCERYLK